MPRNHLPQRAKATLILIVLALMAPHAYAQFLRTSYFMEDTPYRLDLNPALSPGRGYIKLPVVGSMQASASSNSLSTKDIGDIIDDSDKFYTSDKFYNRLSQRNRLNVSFNTDVLSLGWYKGRNFWSVNVGARMDLGAEIPKSMFTFLRAMEKPEAVNWMQMSHLIEKEQLEINAYTEIGVGFARALNSRLTVGGKAKLLLGMGNMKLNIDHIRVSSSITGDVNDPQSWIDQSSASIDVQGQLESSFKGMDLTQDQKGYIEKFDFNGFGIAGYGGAIDLGASYRLSDQFTVSASALDLGFISWSKGSTNIAESQKKRTYDATNYTEFLDIVQEGDVLNYELIGLKVNEGEKRSRTTALYSTLVFGAEYTVLNDLIALGALSSTRFAQPKTQTELTLAATVRPKEWFNFALSYSMIQSAGQSIGVGLKIGPVFVGSDYLFLGDNTKCVNAFLGIAIPLGKNCKKNL
ncbi:MAG: hypothetical protein EOM31_06630 [Bacteroidia bacterium]|nr:hypothetical protein [Bacteroidia bacterium]